VFLNENMPAVVAEVGVVCVRCVLNPRPSYVRNISLVFEFQHFEVLYTVYQTSEFRPR